MICGPAKKNNLIGTTQTNKYYTEDESWIHNDEFAITKIVKKINPGSIVLDVGCAQGKMGKYLKNEKNCTMYGIELDKVAIGYAKKTKAYERIDQYNIEKLEDDTKLTKEIKEIIAKVDYVVSADVLEHLVDPTAVVRAVMNCLKPEAKILISIPNLGHIDIIFDLMNGKFNYDDCGILDNTHLRFFTKHSFAEWIDQMNEQTTDYKIDCKLLDQTYTFPDYEAEGKEYQKVVEAVCKDTQLYVLQNIFSLEKTKNQPTELKKLLQETTPDVVERLNEKLKEIEVLDQALRDIHNSKGYRLLNKLYRLKGKK